MIKKYVIVRREPHGEVVDTYIMACANSLADAEEFVLSMAEEYGYVAFCDQLFYNDMETEEALRIAKEAEIYYINTCVIFGVPEV